MEYSTFLVFVLPMVLYVQAEAQYFNDIESATDLFFNLNEPILNKTLDVYNGSYPDGWEISSFQPRSMEYYSSSSEFVGGDGDADSCALSFSELPVAPSLADVDGVWVTCESEDNLPNITYIMRQLEGFRYLNISYYLHESAAIRIRVLGNCYDYSVIDTGSDCEYIPVERLGGWQKICFVVDEHTISFLRFTIEMIATRENDFVLIDKVEASVYLPCDEGNPADCPRPTTPTTTSTTITTSTPSPDTTITTESSVSTTTSENCTRISTEMTTEATILSSSETPTASDSTSTADELTSISSTTSSTTTCEDEGDSSDSQNFASNLLLLNFGLLLLSFIY